LAGPAGGPEVTHPEAYGVVGRAELRGDRWDGQAVDEEGPQGSVAAMQGLLGLQEETAARCVVHEVAPRGG
jgi:hypothetical protein